MLYYDEEKKRESNVTPQISAPTQQIASPAVSPSQQPAWTQVMGDQLPASLTPTPNQTDDQQMPATATPSTLPLQTPSDAGTSTTPTPTPADAGSVTTATSTSTANGPAVPARNVITANCPLQTPVPGTAPPKKETPVLPLLSTARFGGDAQVETFAKQLSVFHAGRIVQEEVDKRYQEAVTQARRQAEAQGKIDTKKAIEEAVEGVEDQKNKSAIAKARREATEQA